jgi:hypothetical protein
MCDCAQLAGYCIIVVVVDFVFVYVYMLCLFALSVSLTEATHNFMTLHDALATLDSRHSWDLSWFKVFDSTRPLSNLLPGHVTIVKLDDAPIEATGCFWPPRRARRPPRGRVVPPAEDPAEVDQAAIDAAMSGDELGWEEVLAELIEEDDEAGDDMAGQPDVEALDLFYSDDEDIDGVGQGPDLPDEYPVAGLAGGGSDADSSESSGRGDLVGEEYSAIESVPEHALEGAGSAPTDHGLTHGVVVGADIETIPDDGVASAPASSAAAKVPGDAFAWVPGGKITFYDNKKSFEAVCSNPAHGRCVMTRTILPRLTKPSQGRPLGLMSAWLAAGPAAPNKETHWLFLPSHDARVEHRHGLMGTGGGPALVECERPLREGEIAEPMDLP